MLQIQGSAKEILLAWYYLSKLWIILRICDHQTEFWTDRQTTNNKHYNAFFLIAQRRVMSDYKTGGIDKPEPKFPNLNQILTKVQKGKSVTCAFHFMQWDCFVLIHVIQMTNTQHYDPLLTFLTSHTHKPFLRVKLWPDDLLNSTLQSISL